MLKQVYPEELKPIGKPCNRVGKKYTEEGGIDGAVMD